MHSIGNIFLFLRYFVGFMFSAIFNAPLAGVRYAAFRIHFNGCKECQAKYAAGQRPDLSRED
jgi:hypothetical protein